MHTLTADGQKQNAQANYRALGSTSGMVYERETRMGDTLSQRVDNETFFFVHFMMNAVGCSGEGT